MNSQVLTTAKGGRISAYCKLIFALQESLLKDTLELQRQALEQAAQARADATPPHCPRCGQPLSRLAHGHERTIESRFGPIKVKRTRGYCKKCQQWFTRPI